MSADLSLGDSRRLNELEQIVDRGLQGFIEVGNALMEIRSGKLYRQTHPTFKSYCEQRFGFTDSRGRQLIAAAKTVTDVTVRGLPAPATEGEARRLARELRDEGRLEQWPPVVGFVPDIEGDQWISFAASIKRWGVLHPIILFDGYILDGWQRYRACREMGVKPIFATYEGDDPADAWWAANVLRKSYTESELAVLSVVTTSVKI